jgi:hypothetical protein
MQQLATRDVMASFPLFQQKKGIRISYTSLPFILQPTKCPNSWTNAHIKMKTGIETSNFHILLSPSQSASL